MSSPPQSSSVQVGLAHSLRRVHSLPPLPPKHNFFCNLCVCVCVCVCVCAHLMAFPQQLLMQCVSGKCHQEFLQQRICVKSVTLNCFLQKVAVEWLDYFAFRKRLSRSSLFLGALQLNADTLVISIYTISNPLSTDVL